MREMFCNKSRNFSTEIHQWLSVHPAVNISFISPRQIGDPKTHSKMANPFNNYVGNPFNNNVGNPFLLDFGDEQQLQPAVDLAVQGYVNRRNIKLPEFWPNNPVLWFSRAEFNF